MRTVAVISPFFAIREIGQSSTPTGSRWREDGVQRLRRLLGDEADGTGVGRSSKVQAVQTSISLRRGLRGLARLVARTQDRLRHFHRAGRRRSHVPPRKSRRDGQASVRHNRRGSDGSRERRLGRGDDLSWSPSGTHIAVSRDFRKPSLTAPETAIWVLNVDEGGDARSGRDKASASAAPRAAT
jgi:hypothetical protein